MRIVLALILLAGSVARQEAAAQPTDWNQVLPTGHGAFEDVWRPGSWPMGAAPVAAGDSSIWMVGIRSLWESRDGLEWRFVGPLPEDDRAGASAHLHGERLYILGGQAGPLFTTDVASTSDGTSWTRHPMPGWGARRGAALASFRGSLFLFGGENTAPLGDVWRTKDGSSWERVTDRAPWPTEWQVVPVVFRDSLWAFAGVSWNATSAGLWVSSNGTAWERVLDRAPWGSRVFPGILAFEDHLWVLGGVTPAGERLGDVWRSADGRDWQLVTPSAPWTRRAGNRAVVYRDALWLFGGKGKEEDGESGYAGDIWRLAGIR